jgi:hypothetical protein
MLIGDVRMPCLQELSIATYSTNALIRYEGIDQAGHGSWVNSTIRLLHSAPRLEWSEISAPSSSPAALSSEALAEDSNLYIALDTSTIGQT